MNKVLFFLAVLLIMFPDSQSQNLWINEIAASNKSFFLDDFGEFDDWIEIYNPGKSDIDLAGWYISDDPDFLEKWTIRSGQPIHTRIFSGGYLILWADKDTLQGTNHLGIELSKKGEELLLSRKIGGKIVIIDRINYPAMVADRSYCRCPESETGWAMAKHPSPGKRNLCPVVRKKRRLPHPEPSAEVGDTPRLIKGPFSTPNLVINELVARNARGLTDEAGEDDDWVEIYNPGTTDVNIAGWYVSDTSVAPFHRIPASDLAKTLVPAGGYIILWADGQPGQGVTHLPFKFDNDGEEFYLARMVGNVLDIVDDVTFPKLEKDTPFGRFPNGTGSWKRLSHPTPRAANIPPRVINGLIVNELMAVRGSGYLDNLGQEEDWLELYNPTANPIDIGGLYLTDSMADPVLHRIPIHAPDSTTIAPGGYMILFIDGDQNQGVRHVNFRLGGNGETFALYQPDGLTLITKIRFPYQSSDASYGRFPNGTGPWIHTRYTPGLANQYSFSPVTGIRINEIMATNTSYYPDNLGEIEDWIEIYNTNNYPVNVGGFYISDSLESPLKFRIPNSYPDSTTIPAHGFRVFWADNDPRQGLWHLDIKLTGNGEEVIISQYQTSSVTLDSHVFGIQKENVSIGRYPDGNSAWYEMAQPTPGQANINKEVQRTQGVFLNEFMARSTRTFPDEFGQYTDWIEIYNRNGAPVDLGGKYFTNLFSNPGLHLIPSGNPAQTTIPAGGFLVFRADDNTGAGVRHLNFTLRGSGDQIGLYEQIGGLFYPLDSVTYGSQTADISYGRLPDGGGIWSFMDHPTPGTNNQSSSAVVSGVYINEIMARNTRTYQDETGAYEDWIELYNATNQPIVLSGLYLTDDFTDPKKSIIPIGANISISPKGYSIFWADLKPNVGPTHMNFQLAGAGEPLALVQEIQGTIHFVDSITYPTLTADITYGRVGDGTRTWTYFANPTPKASNGTSGIGPDDKVGIDMNIFPNPFTESFFMEVDLPEPGQIHLQILDMKGTLIHSHIFESIQPGKYSVWMEPDQVGVNEPGIYYLRMVADSFMVNKKILYIK